MARSRWLLAVVFIGSMLALGFLDYLVFNSGYEGIATAIWAVGYGTIVLGVWFVWLRPLDFTEPSELESRTWSVDAGVDSDSGTDTDVDAGAEVSSDEAEARHDPDTTGRDQGDATADRTEQQSSSPP
jgi:hypothetical protein